MVFKNNFNNKFTSENSPINKSIFELDLQHAYVGVAHTNYRKKYLSIIENEERVKIKNHFLGKNFCIYLDETCDANGRYILNIFGKVLENCKSPLIFIESVELTKNNSDMILRELIYLIPRLESEDRTSRTCFKALITDGAPCCLKLGREVKNFLVT